MPSVSFFIGGSTVITNKKIGKIIYMSKIFCTLEFIVSLKKLKNAGKRVIVCVWGGGGQRRRERLKMTHLDLRYYFHILQQTE